MKDHIFIDASLMPVISKQSLFIVEGNPIAYEDHKDLLADRIYDLVKKSQELGEDVAIMIDNYLKTGQRSTSINPSVLAIEIIESPQMQTALGQLYAGWVEASISSGKQLRPVQKTESSMNSSSQISARNLMEDVSLMAYLELLSQLEID